MIAAVSAPSQSASTTRQSWHFAPLPDLNRETKHRITKASAWATFNAVVFALRQEGRKGRTPAIRKAAKENEQISVGLRHLARDIGLNVSTVRRHVRHLVEIGVIGVWRPNVSFHVAPDTGRIVTKAKGRCENARVYLTIQPHHLRPSKASGMGADCAHQTADPSPCKAQSAPTVRESRNQRMPDVLTAGAGQPQAVAAGRLPAADAPGLPAGEAGGHSAAKAGREGSGIVPLDAGRDEPPNLPPRLCRAGKAQPTRRTNRWQEEPRTPQEFAGRDRERFEATRRRLEAEKAAREAADTSPPAFGQGTPTFVREAERLRGRPADELAGELHQAASKATKRQRRRAAKAADPVPASDPALQALQDAVARKQAAMREQEQAAHRDRSHEKVGAA